MGNALHYREFHWASRVQGKKLKVKGKRLKVKSIGHRAWRKGRKK